MNDIMHVKSIATTAVEQGSAIGQEIGRTELTSKVVRWATRNVDDIPPRAMRELLALLEVKL